jgi:hypothetical protein
MLARRTFSAGSNLPKLSIPRKTFNELKNFGGGLIDKLNAPGQTAGPECVGRFANLDVAKKRILQGRHSELGAVRRRASLPVLHSPLMRVTVQVK